LCQVPFQKTLEKLYDIPIVGDIRGAGFFWGIEMVKNRETRESFNSDESEQLLRGFLSKALFDNGLCEPVSQKTKVTAFLSGLTCCAGTAGLTTGETPSYSWPLPLSALRNTSTRSR
jgi:adenosylmethionine-8-amino-7-oxononanoate aminotransferase